MHLLRNGIFTRYEVTGASNRTFSSSSCCCCGVALAQAAPGPPQPDPGPHHPPAHPREGQGGQVDAEDLGDRLLAQPADHPGRLVEGGRLLLLLLLVGEAGDGDGSAVVRGQGPGRGRRRVGHWGENLFLNFSILY